MTLVESIVDGVSDNLRTLLIIGGGYIGAVEADVLAGYPAVPSLPGWWPLVGLLLASVLVVGLIFGGRIQDLLESDDDGHDVIVREVSSDRTDCGIYGFSEEGFEKAQITGTLRYLADAPGEQYEAYRCNTDVSWGDNPGYEGEAPTALITGSFLGQEPDAKLVGHYSGADARREIGQIKSDYEDLAAAGRILIEHFPSVVRRLDRDRAVRWVQRLGGDVAGDVGETSDVDEAIKDILPMQLIPARMFNEDEVGDRVLEGEVDVDGEDVDGSVDVDDTAGPSIGEAIDRLVDSDGAGEALATDGGENDG